MIHPFFTTSLVRKMDSFDACKKITQQLAGVIDGNIFVIDKHQYRDP